MNINTIIFDLGGVIIDLDEQATINNFVQLSGKTHEEVLKLFYSSVIFKDYEKGLISSDTFRKEVNQLMDTELPDDPIDKAWNAMLGDITLERLNLLKEIQTNKKVLILSNINAIHEQAFNQILKNSSGEDSIHAFADHVFFSHELHMRKPDIEIYLKALDVSGTLASEALFLDDKKENLEGAESVGIETMLIENPDQIFSLSKYV